MNKPEVIIPEQPKVNIIVDYAKSEIQKEKDELNEMKAIRAATGFSLGQLIELKKKGYKIIKVK